MSTVANPSPLRAVTDTDAPARPLPNTGNALLKALPAEDRAAILEASHAFEFALGDTLCESGGRPEAMEFIEAGVISAIVEMQNGQIVESYMIGREGATHSTLRFGEPCYARLVVQVAGHGRRIEAGRIRALAAERPAIADALGAYAHRLLSELEQSTACNALHRAEARFAKWLLRCHDRIDGDTLRLTQEFLAGMLGAQRTTVNEAAQNLQNDGALRYSRGVLQIIDRPVLERAACECYGAHRRTLDDFIRATG